MPAKNSVKTYIEAGYYHVYNRGVNKRKIYLTEQDYGVFLSYLKTYLLPRDDQTLMKIIANPTSSPKEKSDAVKKLQLNNFNHRIELLAYCLMPNHFHLLLKQTNEKDMQSFLQSLITRYAVYFNKQHSRTGSLFQGRYKAVLIDTDSQILYLTRYIHRNPIEKRSDPIGSDLFKQPSSYKNYLKLIKQEWIKPNFILQNFSKTGFNSYRAFVESEDMETEALSAHLLKDTNLDS